MAPTAWKGDSSSSIAFSANPRDSRVVSIYDKYLYDPKDLESSDPRRRELARKASQLKLHGRPANDLDANGIRNAGPSNSRPAQRKSTAFSQNAKHGDRHTASSVNNMAASSRPAANAATSSQRPDQHDRDSGAFGLGLGMLGGSDSESSSDSDDDSPALRKNLAANKANYGKDPKRPESWTDRAVAVGHRPPDNASQNPPSLKLMALKSGKQSSDLSANSQDQRQNGLAADRTSRHGSTIGFAGPTIDRADPNRPSESSRHDPQRQSAHVALARQLGLASPNLEAAGPPTGPPKGRGAPHPQQPPPQGFNGGGPNNNPARSMPRAAGPPSIDVNRAQQHGFRTSPNDSRPMPSPMGSQNGPPTPNSATPLRSPGSGSAGMPSPNYPPGHGPLPPNVLQRGPPPLNAQRDGTGGRGVPSNFYPSQGPPSQAPNGNQTIQNNGPGRPGAGPGPATGPRPGQPPSMQPGNGARTSPPTAPRNLGAPNGAQSRGPPGPSDRFGPSFSDAPGPSNRRQSIFRRSMAMFGGGSQAGPSANRPGPNNNQLRAQPVKRQSLFRRSVAMLTGGNGGNSANAQRGAPPQQGGQQMRMPVPNVAQPPQAPRVQGMQDDFEKPDHARKSQFLGAGGEGAEWDTFGEGAKFWRRFSMAQKTAGTEKLEEGSRAWMATMAQGKRKLIVMGAIAITILVGIIVGVIVWREIVSPSGSSSNEPSSVYKANLGTNNTSVGSGTSTRRASQATATGSSPSTSNYSARALSAHDVVEDVVERQLSHAAAHEFGGRRMRKRHFGHAIIADAGSLAGVN